MTEHGPAYRFEAATDDDGRLLLNAVKSWAEADEQREARVTVGEYRIDAIRQLDLRDLEEVHDLRGLEAAMQYAESLGILHGTIEPDRPDARLFADGPDDPFETGLERFRARHEALPLLHSDDDTRPLDNPAPPPFDLHRDWLAEIERERIQHQDLEGAAWFEATFSHRDIALLEPLDDQVNYAVLVQDVDPWTRELMVEKYWKMPEGFVGSASLTLETYDPEDEEDIARGEADRAALLAVYSEGGLDALMQQAERTAIANRWLLASADAPFRGGPPDRFVSLRQAEMQAQGIDLAATQAMPAVDPDPAGWDALVAAQPAEEPAYTPVPWQMLTRPAETPDGERLGTAMLMLAYPDLPPDTDLAALNDLPPEAQAATRTHLLELGHFAGEKEAQKIADDFRSVLVPGLLDGPELAPDVARLEGLAGVWEERDYRDVAENVIGRQTLVREADDWHPHQSFAEREAETYVAGTPLLSNEELVQIQPDDPVSAPDFDM